MDAYNYLASINVVPPFISKEEIKKSVDKFTFYTEYDEISSQVTNKTKETLKNINFKGIKINSRGNDKEYFIHIRTKFTLLPWQYYQGKFSVNSKWQEIKINLSEFKRSGVLLPQYIKPQHILSVALVAFGKKHRVSLEVSEIAFY